MSSAGEKYPLYLGLGSNLGDRSANLEEALRRLDEAFGQHWTALSDFMETEPWGFESKDNFLNAVVRYDVEIASESGQKRDSSDLASAFAERVLRICKEIEKEMGRTGGPEYDEAGKRIYHSRIIDIDILLLGDFKVDMEDLKIPHPLMRQRDFVMGPLRQIAPEII